MRSLRWARAALRAPQALRSYTTNASLEAAAHVPAFSIPEEPIAIEHADEATAQASEAQRRANYQYTHPEEAKNELERQIRKMHHTLYEELGGLASTQSRDTSFRPFKLRTQPIEGYELTLSHLLAATAQMGHAKQHVKHSYGPLLYGYRHGQAIIDVERATLPALRRAVQVVRQIAENDGIILIVGTRPNLRSVVRSAVERLGANGFHVSVDRWTPGVLTNASKLLASATQYSVQRSRKEGSEEAMPNMSRLAATTYRPDLVIVLNPTENEHALREATQANVPTMAIVDTNVDPRAVTYAIPANDDSPRVAELVLGVLSKAGEDGLRRRCAAVEAWDKDQRRHRRRAAQASSSRADQRRSDSDVDRSR
ncbi:mitochondrial small ribosomal subunit protein [Malassezia pachydermatis]